MSQQGIELARRALEEVFAAGNLAAVDVLFHPAFINHEAGPNTPPGPAGLKMTVEWLHRSFSDLHYVIEDVIVDGDKVVVRVTATGRHTGEFMGFPPTGKTFSVEQIHIYRAVEGKIIEHWSSRDDLGQGMQLGLIPAGGRAGPGASTPTNAAAAIEVPDALAEISGTRLTKTSEIPVGGGTIVAAAHVVVTQPQGGEFNAFSSTCTHMGCTVGEISEGAIRCPCHGSQFSIADGSVLHGPAEQPLLRYPVRIRGDEVAIG